MDDSGFRIRKLTEADFDLIIESAGGRRLIEGTLKTADYVFGGSVIELKLIEEEGLEKFSRQKKLAELFMATRPGKPVIPLHPGILSERGENKYYNILRGPIQGQVKKAAKQLEQTRERMGMKTRVLIVINNGYAALNHPEFTELALKCATQDTEKIDILLCGGFYFYSAWPDDYVFPRLDIHPIAINDALPDLTPLMASWGRFVDELMHDMVVNQIDNHADGRMPVMDISFDCEGVKFVRPARKMGKPSPFWPDGKRPRKNSSTVQGPQPVALTFPGLSKLEWQNVKKELPEAGLLKDSFDAWKAFEDEEEEDVSDPLQPFVPVEITCEGWKNWCHKNDEPLTFKTLSKYSAHLFNEAYGSIVENARSVEGDHLYIPEYIRVETEEIGLDLAHDVSSAYRVCQREGLESEKPLFENLRIYHEHALCLAAAYAVKQSIPAVRYYVDRTFGAE